ncbi:MAG: energy-coupling factor ABC transporter permease [Archaeoglobales archaeon]|nr:energy-coupling factor ABC transporter permease [Archaeoglobales archaeon]
MHIMEGFIPPEWCILWYALTIPVLILGSLRLKKLLNTEHSKSMLAVAAGFIFVLSALKIPSVTGSCSHPTGTGVAVILFGPSITAVLSFIVLLYQALLLAHGGISTLGANTFSMGIVGPLCGWVVYRLFKKFSFKASIFFAAAVADIMTYVTTSLQLALAFPAFEGFEGIMFSFIRFLGIFAITQVPLAIIEAFLALTLVSYIFKYVGVGEGELWAQKA